jgi:hypothetical protein
MLYDVDRLAGLRPHLQRVGWECIAVHWDAKDCGDFKSYFERYWIIGCPNWWVIALGLLTPRTNAGLEGCWPVIHRLLDCNVLGVARVTSSLSLHYFPPFFL